MKKKLAEDESEARGEHDCGYGGGGGSSPLQQQINIILTITLQYILLYLFQRIHKRLFNLYNNP